MYVNESGRHLTVSCLEVEATDDTAPPVVPKALISRVSVSLVRVDENATGGPLHIFEIWDLFCSNMLGPADNPRPLRRTDGPLRPYDELDPCGQVPLASENRRMLRFAGLR